VTSQFQNSALTNKFFVLPFDQFKPSGWERFDNQYETWLYHRVDLQQAVSICLCIQKLLNFWQFFFSDSKVLFTPFKQSCENDFQI
jgi:hypothetical protein